MSWKATAWAAKQKTGSARRKAVLLALANYADDLGICWPCQETLAEDTEMSVDSIQRHTKALVEAGLITRVLMPKVRGQYRYYLYQLAMPFGLDDAASENVLRPGRTAKQSPPAPQSLRQKPTNKTTSESLASIGAKATRKAAESRLSAFKEKAEPIEAIQNRIAHRIGSEGWLVIGDMTDAQLKRLTNLERSGRLDDETLCRAVLVVRSFFQRTASSAET